MTSYHDLGWHGIPIGPFPDPDLLEEVVLVGDESERFSGTLLVADRFDGRSYDPIGIARFMVGEATR